MPQGVHNRLYKSVTRPLIAQLTSESSDLTASVALSCQPLERKRIQMLQWVPRETRMSKIDEQGAKTGAVSIVISGSGSRVKSSRLRHTKFTTKADLMDLVMSIQYAVEDSSNPFCTRLAHRAALFLHFPANDSGISSEPDGRRS